VGAWTTIGLTVLEFCRRQGVTEASFHLRKRLLRARDEALVVSAKPKLLSVTVKPSTVSIVSFEVRYPSKHVVTVPMTGMTDLVHLKVRAAVH
jgi:hypothetical protein